MARNPFDASNIGRVTALASQARPSPSTIVDVLQFTPVISMRQDLPRQWIVNVRQVVTVGSGVQPWQVSGFDGLPIATGGFFTAPLMPPLTDLRLQLRWGAGGASATMLADYPLAGGTFGVTADTFDLSVIVNGVLPSYATPLDVPVVGCFMVPGQSADPNPLMWLDVPSTPGTEGGDVAYSVKNYARRVRLNFSTAIPVTEPDGVFALIRWMDKAGATILTETVEQHATLSTAEIVVPAQAVIMDVQNSGTVEWDIQPMWLLGLT